MTDTFETGPIAQIAVVVGDIEAKARAWAELFGKPMPEISITGSVETAHTEYRGEPTPARAKLAFFRFGDLSVELIEPIDGPSTWRDQLETHGDSLHHIAFRMSGARAPGERHRMRARIDLVHARGQHMPNEAIEFIRLACVCRMLSDLRACRIQSGRSAVA